MIAVGLRWRDIGTGRTNWRDVWAVMMTLPRTSATARAIIGPDADWSLTDHLLASAVDLLAVANRQRAGRGPKPKPIPRPGVGPKVDKFEMDAFDSPADFDAWRLAQLKK